jgi:tripartite-type tricarboxylate transporter receptor subunit TctC
VTAVGTPKSVIDKIQRDTAKVLQEPSVRDKLAGQGMTAVGDTPAQLMKTIQDESGKWKAIVARRNLSID